MRCERFLVMEQSHQISDLSPVCFWDVDSSLLDWADDAEFIISRVLEVGKLSDWRIIRDHYGVEQIADCCKHLRTMDLVDLNFIATISKTDKRSYRCYTTTQLHPTLWNS